MTFSISHSLGSKQASFLWKIALACISHSSFQTAEALVLVGAGVLGRIVHIDVRQVGAVGTDGLHLALPHLHIGNGAVFEDDQGEVRHMRLGMIQLAVGHPAFGEVTVGKDGTRKIHIIEPGTTEGCTIEFHSREVLVENGAGGEVDTLQGSDGFTFVQFITSNSFGMKEAVTVGGHRFLVGLVFGIPPRHTQWQVWRQKAIHKYQQKSADRVGFIKDVFLNMKPDKGV